MSRKGIVILGNQLFPISYYEELGCYDVFMMEDLSLCTHYKYHKQKLVIFLSAMRSYKDKLKENGFNVNYVYFDVNNQSYEEELEKFVEKFKLDELIAYEVEDKFFEDRLIKNNTQISFKESKMFMSSRNDFKNYLEGKKKPFMKTFYEQMRGKYNVLMDKGGPVGGKYSFDSENRKKMPKSIKPPSSYLFDHTEHTKDVVGLVNKSFSNHPGSLENFEWGTTRSMALKALNHFIEYKIDSFGDYQDSITNRDPFLFHSLISPYLNMGLLVPDDVVRTIENEFHKNDIPLNSVEGFIRQVIGWREFVRGIYQNYSLKQDKDNFFNHKRSLPNLWHEAKTGFPFLDDSIKKTYKYAYGHHIERLMIMGNMMNLLEINPKHCHQWFMEMYIDSSDWVMGPNVYGMALFSDGGIFATKPYICGSNYYRKMSDYKAGEWCGEVDALYWGFINKHSGFFRKNYRMSMMVKMWEKKSLEKQSSLLELREKVLKRIHG